MLGGIVLVALMLAVAGMVYASRLADAKPRPISQDVYGLLPMGSIGYTDPLYLVFSTVDRKWHIPDDSVRGKVPRFSPRAEDRRQLLVSRMANGQIVAEQPPTCFWGIERVISVDVALRDPAVVFQHTDCN